MPKLTNLKTFVPKAIQVDIKIFYTNTYSKFWYLSPNCNWVHTFVIVCQPDNNWLELQHILIWIKYIGCVSL